MSLPTSFSGRRRAASLAGALSFGALALALVTSPVMAATTTPFNTNLVKNGSGGILTLAGSNTYSGFTALSAGILALGSTKARPSLQAL